MRQIKIVKIDGYYHSYDDNWVDTITSGSTWLEVDDTEFGRLQEAIRWANQNTKSTWKYYLVQNIDKDHLDEIFTSAQQVIDKYEKEKAKQEKEKRDYQAKREATALLRKQKQLAKLKKELGEGA